LKFVKWEDLKSGMRLARPIYSKSGVLLYERDAKLTDAGIESVKNFGLLGIYILEPAEPLPPMSEEDLEFEKFEIKTVSSLQDELTRIITTKKQRNLPTIVSQIIRKYGHHDDKVHFYQNLRSREDYVCRHMFNTAILCALMASRLNISVENRLILVTAALVHDIGKISSKNPAVYGGETDPGKIRDMYDEALSAADGLDEVFATDGPMVKRICQQALRCQKALDLNMDLEIKKVIPEAKILHIAGRYDEITGMSLTGESLSEVRAILEFQDNPGAYDPEVVQALIDSVFILFPGVSVELSSGEKALIINENQQNILKPTVITFRQNSIMDLADSDHSDIRVVDIMKTLDNRYIMNEGGAGGIGIS